MSERIDLKALFELNITKYMNDHDPDKLAKEQLMLDIAKLMRDNLEFYEREGYFIQTMLDDLEVRIKLYF